MYICDMCDSVIFYFILCYFSLNFFKYMYLLLFYEPNVCGTCSTHRLQRRAYLEESKKLQME